MRNRPGSRTKRLGMDQLEQRTLLAGNVLATLDSDGTAFIQGDERGNDIIITDNGGGVFTLETGPDTTKINGGPGPIQVGGVSRLVVSTRNGRDSVELRGGNSALSDVRVFTGGGGDAVAVGGFQNIGGVLRVGTRTGSDEVALFDNNVAKRVVVHTHGGNDRVGIVDHVIAERLLVNTGTGSDEVAIAGTDVGGPARLLTGYGNDAIALAGNIFRSSFDLNTHRGDDDARITHEGVGVNQFDGEVNIRMGQGRDQLTVDGDEGGIVPATRNVFRSPVQVQMGGASDVVVLGDNDFLNASSVILSGGQGVNSLGDAGNNVFAPGQPQVVNF